MGKSLKNKTTGSKKVLITGGAGFIGSYLSNKLIDLDYGVTIIDNLHPQIHGEDPHHTSPLFSNLNNNVEFIEGDVRNADLLKEHVLDKDIIIHLAAETGTGQSMYEISRYSDVNNGGTANLLNVLTTNPNICEKLLIASSRAVYGEGKYLCKEHGVQYPDSRLDSEMQEGNFNCKCDICGENLSTMSTSEDSKLAPGSIYGITKLSQEMMMLNVGNALDIPTFALRLQNVYGPGQSLTNPYTGILSIFSNLILQARKINVFEDGLESRDFVFIDDVVNAFILFINDGYFNSGVYNVGTGEAISVLEVTENLYKAYKKQEDYFISGNYRVGDIRHNVADISKISALGYKPDFNFEKGIRLFCDWVKTQEINDSKYDASLDEMKAKNLFK
jgi:dTDP-L-rhamnose 4-epimerase